MKIERSEGIEILGNDVGNIKKRLKEIGKKKGI